MQIFPVGRVFDFMGQRRMFAVISMLMTLTAAVLIV